MSKGSGGNPRGEGGGAGVKTRQAPAASPAPRHCHLKARITQGNEEMNEDRKFCTRSSFFFLLILNERLFIFILGG